MLGTARLAAGGVALPGSLRGRAAFALLDRAFELGIRALDTAAIYQFGGSERLIGAWLQSAGIRDRIYLIGKGGHPSLLWRPRLGRRDLERDLDGSLLRLGTDRLDLYLLHRDAAGAPLEPIAQALWSFVADGRIRAYGVSNWTHEAVRRPARAGAAPWHAGAGRKQPAVQPAGVGQAPVSGLRIDRRTCRRRRAGRLPGRPCGGAGLVAARRRLAAHDGPARARAGVPGRG